MSVATKTDLGVDTWAIDDGVVRLREWGTDRSYPLPADPGAEVTIGSSDACGLVLVDPSGRLSRQHAQLSREGTRWIARDLGSKNGMRFDGVRRPKVLLEPGSELGLGGITLVAESARLIALRGFLARILGWTTARAEAVDLAVRSVRLAATRRAALALCGDGDLVPIARGLHRYSLGADRPFVLCDPRRRATDGEAPVENHASGLLAVAAAAGGSMCVWPKRLPRDFAEVTATLHDPSTHVQLIACGQRPSDRTELVSAPIEIPPLSTRLAEIDRVIDEYARDAAASMGISSPLSRRDRDWVRIHSGTSLIEIEKGASRILALREAGSVAGAAALLGMAHASLGEWIGRRRLPPGTLA
ncbi:MAG TPA: FHA domain-containing protein [Kofleriaceae bacterium]|nr:FHA domain-containing protein [Kofleriaceae bacterium]